MQGMVEIRSGGGAVNMKRCVSPTVYIDTEGGAVECAAMYADSFDIRTAPAHGAGEGGGSGGGSGASVSLGSSVS